MSEVKEFNYDIGGKTYTMLSLRMGQVHQLLDLLKDQEIPDELTVASLFATLGPKLKEAIAIVLHVPDVRLQDKNIAELADEIAFEITPEQEMEIIEDFFDCTPISSILERMSGMVEKITEKLSKKEIG